MTVLLLVTFISLVIAVVMSVVAWRAAGEERRRSEARIAALAADIHDDDLDLGERDFDLAPAPASRRVETIEPPPLVSTPDGMFAAVRPAESGSRFATVAALGVIVVGTLATIGLLVGSGSHRSASPVSDTIENRSTGDVATASTKGGPLPLELVALGHDRDGDRLTVRGVVRNPVAGAPVQKLTAVVLMFNRDGDFLGSGRATVESSALTPGGETTFVVTVPNAADVGRYRVSFRTEDRIVPHVDRREHALARS